MFMMITKGCMTMVVDRVYRISVFGNFDSIKATPENMQFFLEVFKDDGLLPTIFQELQVNVPTVPGNPVPPSIPNQRIMLISSDGSTKVTIGANRIDYDFVATVDIKLTVEQRSEINQRVINTFSFIFKKFRKSASRLALNTESLIINLSPNEFNSFMSKYTNPISLYNSVRLDEWSTRLMVRKSASIGNNEESINVITIIQKQEMTQTATDGTVSTHDGFAIQTDINTIAENTASRFTALHINEFINVAVSIWDKIIDELDGTK